MLSTVASKENSNAGTDDPAQSILTDLAGLVDKYNASLAHMNTSSIIKNALQIGNGLEQNSGSTSIQIKLPAGSGLRSTSAGLTIDSTNAAVGGALTGSRFRQANVITKTGDFSVTSTDEGNLFVHNSTAAHTATLPSLTSANQDKVFHFYNKGPAVLTIDGNGSDTVDGNSNIALPVNSFLSVVSNNSNSDNHTTLGGALRTGQHTAVVRATGFYSDPSATQAFLSPFHPGGTTNNPVVQGAYFDDTAANVMCFGLKMPKSWDIGTVDCYVNWTTDGTATGGVAWSLSALARGDGDTWNTTYGTSVIISDTRLGQYFHHRSPVGAITVGGTPAKTDEVIFRIERAVASSLDTMSTTAIVTSVEVLLTLNAGNDA